MAEKKDKKYLSLKEAAKMFGYAPDYIGFLIRNGKVKGKKIYSGISWQLTPQEILEYCGYCSAEKEIRFVDRNNPLLQKKFLSLHEASELSGYSADYLGQLIRKEIIRGKKIYTQTFWLVNRDDLEKYHTKELTCLPAGMAPKKAEKKEKSPAFDFKNLGKRWALGWGLRAGFVALIIFSFISGWAPAKFLQSSLGAIFVGDTKIINFYPSTSNGDWQNSQNVQGEPNIGEEGNINSFTEFNSAVYQTGSLSILIGNFESPEPIEIPQLEENILPQLELPIEEEQSDGGGECKIGANRPCSSEVGECQIGVQVCQQGYWGECLGAVMPRKEICDGVDNDCNGSIDDGENTCPFGPYQFGPLEPEISFFQKFKNFFGARANAQGKDFSAKIKFSFAMGEKSPDILFEQPIDIEATSSEETGFWRRVKNFFSDLFDEKSSIVEAQEAAAILEEDFQNETTSDATMDVGLPLFLEEPEVSGGLSSADLATTTDDDDLEKAEKKEKEEKDSETTTTEDILEEPFATSTEDILEECEDCGSPSSATSSDATSTEDVFIEGVVADLDTRIVVFWSLDGEVWRQLGVISEYPTSNVLNGGYFEYAAPFLNNFEDVKNLKIKFEGLVGGETNVAAYLDSVWVEAEYQKNVTPPGDVTLEEKEVELLSERKDFQADEEPEFKFHYDKKDKESLLAAVGEFLGLVDEWRDTEISAESEFPTEVVLGDDGEFSVKLDKPDNFKPGVYKLTVKVDSEEFTQEFTWGVLAINVNKSIYLPNEQAYIQMAALADDGHTICDANLQLEITPPNGSSTPVLIEKSGDCRLDNVTDVPDYFTYYQTAEAGVYQMVLTNLYTGRQIIDSFEVRDSVPFEVERIGPTRIWPRAGYQMTLKIKVNQNFVGEVRESVPDGFEITDCQQCLRPGLKHIVWEANWKAGETYELKYRFDAPDISPYLYLLGPLSLSNFTETRSPQSLIDRVLGFVNPTYENKMLGLRNPTLIFEEIRKWQVASDSPGDRIIEQQINIIDQEYSTTTITAVPTDNRLGLIRWTGGSYGGTSNAVYFEAVMKIDDPTYIASSTLYTSAGVPVAGSTTSTQSSTYTRIRSGNIASSLASGTDYTVRIASISTNGIASIKAARLIIVQSTTTGYITDTETQVEVGNASSSITSTSNVTTTDPKIYLYDADVFTPTPTAYFEATIKTYGQASTTVFNSTTTVSTSPYSWVVPTDVTSITIKVWGAGGAGGSGISAGEEGGAGGGGGFAQGVMTVTPGNTLKVYVGGGGVTGGGTLRNGGGGGGLTGVFLTSTSTPLVIAGGGGGGGGGGDINEEGGSGGGGGGDKGADGVSTDDGGGNGGGGGTQTSGGAGGTGAAWEDGQQGDASNTAAYYGGGGGDIDESGTGDAVNGGTVYGGAGGVGGGANDSGGGGGGGTGYHGGGGGEAGQNSGAGEAGGGGGGGSAYILNYTSNASNSSTTGTTSALLNTTGGAAANTGDPDWLASAGYGGNGGVESQGGTGQPGRVVINYTLSATTSAALYTLEGVEVANSAVTTTNTSWARVRTISPITLTDNTQYVVRVKTSDGVAAGAMANAKIILKQEAALNTGIEKLETYQQYLNTATSTIATASTTVEFYNYYDPSSWSGGDVTRYFEATMMAPSGQTIFADSATATDTIANSGIATTTTAYGRQRSAVLTVPSSATNTDTRVRVSGGTGNVSNSWLIHQVTNLNRAIVALTQAVPIGSADGTTLMQGETDHWMGTFGFQSDFATTTMTAVTLTLAGSQVAADLSKIYLYWDDDNVYTSGAEALFASSTSIGITTGFSSSTGVLVPTSTIGYLHVVFDIAGGAVVNNTTGGTIASNGHITYTTNATTTGAPKETGNGTIQKITPIQRAFILENDDGSTVNNNSDMESANTTSTSVKKGQRLIARFQIDSASAITDSFKLQYNTGWNTGSWVDVMGSGPPSTNKYASTSDWSVTTTDSTGSVGSYTSLAIAQDGLPIVSYFDNSNANLNIAKCTAEPCTTQTNWSTTSVDGYQGGDVGLDTSLAIGADGLPIVAYRQLSGANYDLNIAKCTAEPCTNQSNWATTSVDGYQGGDAGYYTSLAIGADGLPIVSYGQSISSNYDLNIAKCNTWPCTQSDQWSTTSVDGYQGGNVGYYTSLAIAADGLPIVSYQDRNNWDLNIAKCNTWPCTQSNQWSTSTVDDGVGVGQYSSIAIGTDGLPIVSYEDNNTVNLNFAKCNQEPCTTATNWSTSTVDSVLGVGQYISLAIGKDGFPIISYQDVTREALKIVKCNDIACSGGDETITTVNQGSTSNFGTYTSIAIGKDGWPWVSYYDDDNDDLKVAHLNPLTEIQPALGLSGANKASLTANEAGACSGGMSFTAGAWYEATNTSNVISLSANQCTELAFVLDTREATASTTYRLRLISTDDTVFSTYANYPAFTIASSTENRSRYSKEAILTSDSSASTTDWSIFNLDGGIGDAGSYGFSTVIGTDGLPILFYARGDDPYYMVVAKCNQEPCTTKANWSTTSIDAPSFAFSSAAITPDGLPIVSYRNWTATDLIVAECVREPCTTKTNWATTTVDGHQGDNAATWSSIAIGRDGLPIISYRSEISQQPKIAKCTQKPCTIQANWTTTTLETTGNSGQQTSIAITQDGLPIVSYYDVANADLKIAKCTAEPCTTQSNWTAVAVDGYLPGGLAGQYTSIAMASDGLPIISYYDAGGGDLKVAKCTQEPCTTQGNWSIGTPDSTDNVGQYTSLGIGPNGFPVIAYQDVTNNALKIAKCNDVACSGENETITTVNDLGSDADSGGWISMVIGKDGYPWVSYVDGNNFYLKVAKQLGLPTTAIGYYNRTTHSDQQAKVTRVQWTGNSTSSMIIEHSPLIEDGLAYWFDKGSYSAVLTDDTATTTITSSGNSSATTTPLFYFAEKHATSTKPLYARWIGQSTTAATSRTIYLQIFRFATSSAETGWYNVASNSTCNADNDCDIQGSTTSDMAFFYYPEYNFDESTGSVLGTSTYPIYGTTTLAEYWTFWRVYQDPAIAGQDLKTDYWKVQFSAFATPITVSGTVYTDEGVTNIGAGKTVTLAVNNNTVGSDTTDGLGAYTITNVTIPAVDAVLTAFLDATDEKAVTVSNASSTSVNIEDLHLYQNRVIVRDQGSPASALTNTNMDQYDSGNDGNIPFTVSGTSLTVSTTAKLYIWPNKTFNPGGTITMLGDAQAAPGGDIHIANGATFTAGGAISVSGNWIASSTAIFTAGSNTVTMTATTTGKEIWTPGDTADFYNLTFDGSGGTGGGWTFKTDATTTNNLTITDGTVTAPGNLYVSNNYSNLGVFTAGTGNVWFIATDSGNTISGNATDTSAFNNLRFATSSDGSTGGWSLSNDASTTNDLTITAGTLQLNGKNLEVQGGDINVTGTLSANVDSGTTTISSTGNLGGSGSTQVYNLSLEGATTLAGNIDANKNLTVTSGNSLDVSVTDYQINVGGSWLNTGTFTARNGTVIFDSTALTETITPGNSAFASTTFDGSGGGWTWSGTSVTTTNNLTIRNGNVTSTTGIWYIGGNASTSNSVFFGHNSGTVRLYGTTSTDLNSGCSDTTTCGNDFYNLIIDKTVTGNDTVTTTNHLRIANTLTLTDGQLYQGSSGETYDIRVEGESAVSVSALGTWTNHGRGDLILGGDVSNLGTIDFKTDNQTCDSPSQTDDILINSTTTPNKTDWSGAGTYTMYHIKVKDQTATGVTITVNGGYDDGGNSGWVFASCGVTISGTLYSNEGVTQITSGEQFIAMKVNGTTYYTTTTYSGTGAWHIDGVSGLFGSIPIIVYVTTTDNSVYAATVTKASSTDAFTGLDLYQNRVIVKHEASSGTSTDNTELGLWDGDDDADIQFRVSGADLTMATTSKLYIWPGKTYAPGGTITTAGDGANWAYPGGDLHIAEGATLTAGGNISVAGSWIASSTASTTMETYTVTMTATTTGKEIWTAGVTSTDFYNLTFDGSGGTGGAWSFKSQATTTNNFTINDGTVTLPATTLYVAGNFFADDNPATFVHNSGTVLFNSVAENKTVDDGGSSFFNIIFDGVGGSWLYQDGTSTAPNLLTVRNGTATLLNAKTGVSPSVTGGTLLVDWYLGVNLVDATNTSQNINTDTCNDVTVTENTASSTIYKYDGTAWTSTGSNSTTTGTGTVCGGPSAGINPQPGSTGAIRIREYERTANGTSTYKYNLKVAWQNNWGEYNWSADYGSGNYLFSSSTSGNYNVIGERWHRTSSTTINSPYACADGSGDTCLNQAPTNGSWYSGLITGLIFSIPSGFSADFGTLDSTNNWTASASTTLNVKTSATNGYSITAWSLNDGQMQLGSLGIYISKWSGTNAAPSDWDNNCPVDSNSCGFGYSTDEGTLGGVGDADRFINAASCGADDRCWAGFSITGAGDLVGDFGSPTTTATTTITYKVSTNAAQAAGNYQTTIIYIATPNY